MEEVILSDIPGSFDISFVDRRLGREDALRHYHDAYEFVFFIKADIQLFVKDKQLEIKDGDLLFIDEYTIHRILYSEDTQYTRYVISFKKDYLFSLLQLLGIESFLERINAASCFRVNAPLNRRSELDSLCRSLFRRSFHLNSGESSSTQAMIKPALVLLLGNFFELLEKGRDSVQHNKKDTQVQDLVHFIDLNYMSPIDLELLENRFFISKYYISRIFRQITGFSVMEYLQYRRILEAQKLLKGSSRSITDISFDCGFNNIQHFYRTFKKISTLSPYQYRKKK